MQNLNEAAEKAAAAAITPNAKAEKPAPKKPARSIKAGANKPKPAPVKAAAKPATDKPDATAILNRGLARDAATVLAQRTNFETYSDRDTAYLAFFGSVMRKHGGKATLAQIHEAGTDAGKNKRRNPRYSGSAKATDAGAINRLIKAGYIKASSDGNTLQALPLALKSAAYLGKASS